MAKPIQTFHLSDQSVLNIRETDQTKVLLDAFRKLEQKRDIPLTDITAFQKERDTFLYLVSLIPETHKRLSDAMDTGKKKFAKEYQQKLQDLTNTSRSSLETMNKITNRKKSKKRA